MQNAHIFILRKCKEITARVYLASTLAGLDVVGMLEIVQKVLFITTVILSEILKNRIKDQNLIIKIHIILNMYTRDKDIQIIYIAVGVGERIHKRHTFG